jgi:multicomponent Na+:H+ antiporter subunit A
MISFAVLGLVMSALFVLQGAPDVAMTQLLVEILTVIILVIALRKAKIVPKKTPVTQKISHAIVAILMGSAITALLTNVQGTVLDSKLSQYFIDNSLTLAHGRNVVNVILVDFRALDTLGEALVILAVALATWLLISKRPSRQRQPGAR